MHHRDNHCGFCRGIRTIHDALREAVKSISTIGYIHGLPCMGMLNDAAEFLDHFVAEPHTQMLVMVVGSLEVALGSRQHQHCHWAARR